jgi:hypothetical protein
VLCFALLAANFAPDQLFAEQLSKPNSSLSSQEDTAARSTINAQPVVAYRPKLANFEREHVSLEARHVADWVVDSGDNRKMPFVIVDKKDAKVFVFYPDGRLRGAARALLGLALGDDAIPGIGERKMSAIRPEERTTPAGRFVASLGRNFGGIEILWVDYDAAISMHRVVTNKPKERRLQRLLSTTTNDKRISYGCINVPVKFFDKVVRPAFRGTNGIVYVLPETKLALEVFGSYDVEEHARLKNTSQPVSIVIPSGAVQ